MKLFKLSALAAVAAFLVMGFAGRAFAFHDGGVGACDGCHTMHNTKAGVKMTVAGTVLIGNVFLLRGTDPSSTCLSCHGTATALSTYMVATDAAGFNGTTLPAQRTPGGDFSWLKVSYNSASGTFAFTTNEALNRQGHHIVSIDYNFAANTDNGGLAPGGTYPSNDLSCISCHNPHSKLRLDGSILPLAGSGSYGATPPAGSALGVYRLLGGIDYIPPGVPSANAFAYDPPIAVAPVIYNQTEQVGQVRVAYGRSMSEWCANCHIGIFNLDPTASTTHRHVASNTAILNQLMPDGVTNAAVVYNEYVNSGNLTGGSQTTAYLTLVPYELGTADNTTLLSYAGNGISQIGVHSLEGPILGTENVMCLSCHRAHATGFDSMTRFDLMQTLITDGDGNWSYTNSVTLVPTQDTSGYYQAAYYDRVSLTVFGPNQRVLCNKCHGQG